MNRIIRSGFVGVALVAAPLLGACGGGQGGSGTTSSGLVHLQMTNEIIGDELLPASAVTHVFVTISRITVGVEDEDDDTFATLTVPRETVDLMALEGGAFATLGITQLPAGEPRQIRLTIDPAGPNYVVTPDGMTHTLEVPSSVVRVVGDFDIQPCATGTVTLAFAGTKSILVMPAGSGTEWMLRPVIRVKEVLTSGTCPSIGEGDDQEGRDKGDHGHGQ